jgi:hypothetical protein
MMYSVMLKHNENKLYHDLVSRKILKQYFHLLPLGEGWETFRKWIYHVAMTTDCFLLSVIVLRLSVALCCSFGCETTVALESSCRVLLRRSY